MVMSTTKKNITGHLEIQFILELFFFYFGQRTNYINWKISKIPIIKAELQYNIINQFHSSTSHHLLIGHYITHFSIENLFNSQYNLMR